MSVSPELTLIIPTRNRSFLLRRVLRYYHEVRLPYPLLIGDAGDTADLSRNRESVEEVSGRLQVSWERQTEDMIEGILALLEKVKTPYVVLAGDDDFFIPRGLERCVRFLSAHPDFNSACGDVLSVFTHPEANGGLGLGYSFGDAVRSFTDERPSHRVLRFYSPQTVNTTYFVQRTEHIRHILRLCVELKLYLPQNALSEGALTAHTLMKGKLQYLPGLTHVRLRHRDFPIRKEDIENHDYGLFIYEEIIKGGWAEKLRASQWLIARELTKNEVIDPRTASYVAEAVFLGWFGPRLTRNRDRVFSEIFPFSPKLSWRRRIKGIPGVKKLWNRLQGTGRVRLSVAFALNPASPHHTDFIPVYRALTESLPEPVIGKRPPLPVETRR